MATLMSQTGTGTETTTAQQIAVAIKTNNQTNETRVVKIRKKNEKNNDVFIGAKRCSMLENFNGICQNGWYCFKGAFEMGKIEQTFFFFVLQTFQETLKQMKCTLHSIIKLMPMTIDFFYFRPKMKQKQTKKNSTQLRIAFKFGHMNCRNELKWLFSMEYNIACNSKLLQWLKII